MSDIRSCRTETGQAKVRFDNRSAAKARIRELGDDLAGAHAYRCPICGYFHIGHYPTSALTRTQLREQHRGGAA